MGADLVQISGQVCDFHSALCHVWVCMLTFVCAWLTWGALCWLWNGVDVEWLVVFVCHRSWVGFRTVRAEKFLSWQWTQILQRRPSSLPKVQWDLWADKTIIRNSKLKLYLCNHVILSDCCLVCLLFYSKPLSLYVTSWLIWLHTEEGTCLGLYVTSGRGRRTSTSVLVAVATLHSKTFSLYIKGHYVPSRKVDTPKSTIEQIHLVCCWCPIDVPYLTEVQLTQDEWDTRCIRI